MLVYCRCGKWGALAIGPQMRGITWPFGPGPRTSEGGPQSHRDSRYFFSPKPAVEFKTFPHASRHLIQINLRRKSAALSLRHLERRSFFPPLFTASGSTARARQHWRMFYSRIQSWCIQRVANLSLLALLCLMFLAFWPASKKNDDTKDDAGRAGRGRHRHFRPQITTSQLALVYYTIFVHVLGLLFPVRLWWAVRSMTSNLKRAETQAAPVRRITPRIQFKTSESESGYEDSISSDCSESEVEVATESSFTTESEYEDELLVHAIILPNYKEEMDTLRETLEVLASHQLARSSYEVRWFQINHAGSLILTER
jgi:hypothetical protein